MHPLEMRSQLRLARTEHHAAAATLSLSRLNSSFMANRERLESSEKSAEQLKIQRAAAELKIRQLQHRLRAKDAEVRRLKSQNRQLVEQADTEALESRRPSDATSLREIPADPSECLFSELGRAALARPSEMPAPQQPVYDALVNPTPRSATSDSLPLSTTLSTYSFPSRLSFPMPPTSDRFERSSTIHTPNGLSRTNSLNSSLGHHGIRLKSMNFSHALSLKCLTEPRTLSSA